MAVSLFNYYKLERCQFGNAAQKEKNIYKFGNQLKNDNWTTLLILVQKLEKCQFDITAEREKLSKLTTLQNLVFDISSCKKKLCWTES